MGALFRWTPRVVLLLQAVVLVLGVRAWLNTGTYRLYLDDRADVASSSDARQRHEIEGSRVVPEILTHGDDRFRFRAPDKRAAALKFRAEPVDGATVEVSWTRDGEHRALGRHHVSAARDFAYQLPAPGGLLEFAGHGTLVWSDLRIEETFPWWPHATMLALLFLLGALLPRAHPLFSLAWSAHERFVLVRLAAGVVAACLGLGALELGLRVMARAAPSWLALERSHLGEVAPDPHWQDSTRYGRRPRPNRNATGEWTHGDIVRMGFIPLEVSPGLLHRFPLRTDPEGFRNDDWPPDAAVAALGDSFTDALTLPAELGWPARLSARLRQPVRNYGVAGFGPQQELRVLEDYVVARRPRLVIVAFFAGNDIPGAALFDEFERTGARGSFGVAGWPGKRVVARFDRFYLLSLARRWFAQEAYAAGAHPFAAGGRRIDAASSGEDPSAGPVPRATFDRGMFAVPVGGRPLRFALMPPYLNLLNLRREELEAHPGWGLTRATLREMERACRKIDARLVVMFVPSKSQVYLPVLRQGFGPAELRSALAFSLPGDPRGVDVDRLSRNRLAQNDLVRGFCRDEDIAFLDITPALERKVQGGQNVYLPDDSHWNALGHDVAAVELVRFLSLAP